MSLDEARRTRAEALLGHTFADPSLLAAALTHPNAAGQGGPDWQRLEFLGDSVLNVAVSEAIFLRHPEVPEGGLTKLRATMVSGPALTEAGRRLGLEDLIEFGAGWAEQGGRGTGSAIEACMEALCAALYLDGGLAAAAAFVDRAVISQAGTLPTATEHPRVALTELVQARGETVEFRVVESRGPAHERVFTVEAHVAGRLLGAGSGPSKKEAAARASEAALASLRDAR